MERNKHKHTLQEESSGGPQDPDTSVHVDILWSLSVSDVETMFSCQELGMRKQTRLPGF